MVIHRRPAQPPGHADSHVRPVLKEQADGGYQGSTDEDEVALTPPEPVEVSIEPPASVLLDHNPTASEILATLRGAFGEVEVLGVVPNDRPATAYTTTRGRVIDLTGGKRPEGKQSTVDLHQAVDELQRQTCVNGPCRPGKPCRRHTPRRRA
jgi:hypothetical protein